MRILAIILLGLGILFIGGCSVGFGVMWLSTIGTNDMYADIVLFFVIPGLIATAAMGLAARWAVKAPTPEDGERRGGILLAIIAVLAVLLVAGWVMLAV